MNFRNNMQIKLEGVKNNNSSTRISLFMLYILIIFHPFNLKTERRHEKYTYFFSTYDKIV